MPVNILITKPLMKYASLLLISICNEIKVISCECCHQFPVINRTIMEFSVSHISPNTYFKLNNTSSFLQ